MKITCVQGDITEQDVDAIVNAANHTLLGGLTGLFTTWWPGDSGSAKSSGGHTRRIADSQRCDTADAQSRVIHAGPTYGESKDKSQLLADCFRTR
jgi:hypothetical protein